MPLPLILPIALALGLAAAAEEIAENGPPKWSFSITDDVFNELSGSPGPVGWLIIDFHKRTVEAVARPFEYQPTEKSWVFCLKITTRYAGDELREWFEKGTFLEENRRLLVDDYADGREIVYDAIYDLPETLNNDQVSEVMTAETYLTEIITNYGSSHEIMAEGLAFYDKANQYGCKIVDSEENKREALISFIAGALEHYMDIEKQRIRQIKPEEVEVRKVLGERHSGIAVFIEPTNFSDTELAEFVALFRMEGPEIFDDSNGKGPVHLYRIWVC